MEASMKTITIDPISRIEGHLAVELEIQDGRVKQAFCKGEMFRGFEVLLQGRSPLDAQQITQRICGVCPISHGVASCLAQESAYDIKPPKNGRLLRDLILCANFIQSHLTHFYQMSLADFIDFSAAAHYQGADPKMKNLKDWAVRQSASNADFPGAPFLQQYEGRLVENRDLNLTLAHHYIQSLAMRRTAHQCAALFSGKMPHASALVPGGVTETVTPLKIARYQSQIQSLLQFISDCYLTDLYAVAEEFPEYFTMGQGYGAYMAYGVFGDAENESALAFPRGLVVNGELSEFDIERISETTRYSFFKPHQSPSIGQNETVPQPDKEGAYSWIKAPRYNRTVVEVGPLARMLVAYHTGKNNAVKKSIDDALKRFNKKLDDLNSAWGRHLARALECQLVAQHALSLVDSLQNGEPTVQIFTIPNSASGAGLTEAPRGALGHWLVIESGKVSRYQCVVPTTWNCSPRDAENLPGALEKALETTPVADADNPLEAARVVRSFDPCLACAVH